MNEFNIDGRLEVSRNAYDVEILSLDDSYTTSFRFKGKRNSFTCTVYFRLGEIIKNLMDIGIIVSEINDGSERFFKLEGKFNIITDRKSKFVEGIKMNTGKLPLNINYMFFNDKVSTICDCTDSYRNPLIDYSKIKKNKDMNMDIKIWISYLYIHKHLNDAVFLYNMYIANIANVILSETSDINTIKEMYDYTVMMRERHPKLTSLGIRKKLYSRLHVYHALILCYRILTIKNKSDIIHIKKFIPQYYSFNTRESSRDDVFYKDGVNYFDIVDFINNN